MAAIEVQPLIEILAEIPDTRQSQGKRHPLSGMLTLAVVAVMCGYESISGIAEWGKNYGEAYQDELGFGKHGYPAQITWYRVFRQIDIQKVEEKLGEWSEAVLQKLSVEGELEGVSLDGKTLRGSKKQGAENSHLLAAASHRWGIILRQIAVDDHTNEISVVEDILLQLALKGRVITADALLTQQKAAETIVNNGGNYVLPVKLNQELTYKAIELWFDGQAPHQLPNDVAQRTTKGHGRLTTWYIEVTSALNDYLDWPDLEQCLKLTRRNTNLTTGEISEEIHYGISSLSPEQASPLALLDFKRHHWRIENRVHWVRDVTFDEDRSQIRVGHAHQLMAALRNLVISLLRVLGFLNIASALRFFAARPRDALNLLSHPLPIGE